LLSLLVTSALASARPWTDDGQAGGGTRNDHQTTSPFFSGLWPV